MAFSLKTRTLGLIGAAALSLTMVAPALADTATTTVTGAADVSAIIGGSPTLTLSGGGSPIYQHTGTQTVSGDFSIEVDDARGTDAGWTVSVSASDFVDNRGTPVDTTDDRTIDAGTNFDQSSASVVTHVAGDPASGVTPTANPATLNLETGYVVLGATAGNGSGSYTATMPVSLTIPAQTLVGSYSSTVTVTVGTAPA
jgi:hypothetical protein